MGGLYPTITGTKSQMQQQKKRVTAPNRTCMTSKIRLSGYVSIYQEFVEKKKKRVLDFKFLNFLGDGFGVKEKKRQARANCVRPSRAPTSTL